MKQSKSILKLIYSPKFHNRFSSGLINTLLLILLIHNNSSAQKWNIKQYDYTDGIGTGVIKCIAQDSIGFLWIGSSNGIFRFDGNSFSLFPLELQDTIITNDYISDIIVARNGNILFTHGNTGFTEYNYEDFSFSNLNPKSKGLFLNSKTGNILQINNKEFLVGARKSRLYISNIEQKTIDPIPGIRNFMGFFVDSLTTNNNIIIAHNEGITSYTNKNDLVEISTCLGYHIKNSKMGYILVDRMLRKIISADNKEKNCKEIIKIDDEYYPITSTLIDSHNNLWIGTNNGLIVYNSTFNKMDLHENIQLSGHKISTLFQDKHGSIWVGHNRGLSQIYRSNAITKSALETSHLSQVRISKTNKNSYLLNSINSNYLWEWNPKNKSVEPIYDYTVKDSMEFLYETQFDGNLNWLFFLNGIASYNVNTKTFRRTYFNKKGDNRIHRSKKQSFIDSNKKPWFVLRKGSYLYRINSHNSLDTFEIPHRKSTYNYSYFKIDDQNRFIYAIDKKISIYNPQTKDYTYINFSAEDYSPIEYNKIIPYGDSTLWSIDLNGVLKKTIYRDYSIVSNEKKLYQNDNLNECIDFQYNEDNIYILTKEAVLKHDLIDESWVEVKLTGIPIDRNNVIEIIGDTLFILSQGVHYIPLKNFNQSEEKVEVKIIQLEINNLPIVGGKNTFSHYQNNLHLDFTSINFTKPETIKYRYRINSQSAWKYVDNNDSYAIFSGLKPDKYTFEVQARNSNSTWGPTSQFNFSISPPFYLSWPFLLISSLLLLITIYGLFSWRVRGIRKISEMRTRMAELENEALRSQMNPHFIFNSLNSIKSFIIKNKKNEAADYLTQFSILIRTILNNSRQKYISLSEEIEALNLYMEMENIRLENKFDVEYNIEHGIQLSDIQIPPLTLQPFVENAIWHGFIHKKTKGKLLIEIYTIHGFTKISILDDGVGREQSQQIEKNHNRKRSYGIFITKQRLNTNAEIEFGDHIFIEDLYDDENNPSGTKITITIPHFNYP